MRVTPGLLLAALSIATPYNALAAPASHAAHHADDALDAALNASTRTARNVERDKYRHPKETLGFFGIRPDIAVVEIWPGSGWYTEILAPYLARRGTYYAAAAAGKATDILSAKLKADPAVYGKVKQTVFPSAEGSPRVPDASADLVLTFRNAHNWIMAGDDVAAQAFHDFFRMLKPGGVLGVLDHRLPEDADSAKEKSSGYVKVSTIKRLAESAGFRLDAESEMNANPLDTKNYPQGVWTLPPTLKLGDQDRARYLAIGESDRMTLRFVKPAR